MTSPAPETASKVVDEPAPENADEIVVRRDRSGQLKRLAVALALTSLLLFWMPAMIVLLRREPGYFTWGIIWTALIATAVLLAAGLGLAALWQRTGARRRPLLVISRDGVRIPHSDATDALDARWEDLALVRLIGHRDPEMAFYLKPVEPQEPEPTEPQLDLSEPEFLRPLDFEADPPPPMRVPGREVFERIAPLPEEEVDEEPTPEPAESAAQRLYATPHIVPVGQTTPQLREVIRAVRRLAAGRVPLG